MTKASMLQRNALAFAAGAALAVGITSARADADLDAVKAAQTAYIAAVDSLDPAKLEALWVHDETVLDYEPGSKDVAVGWENVKKKARQFSHIIRRTQNTISDGPYIQTKGDSARVVTKTAVFVKTKDGATRSAEILQTDIYERRGGAWLLVSHSASRVPK